MNAAESDDVTIQPFDPKRHDRSGFSCGVEQVDNYFKQTANKLRKAGNVRLMVMTTGDNDVLGFYALNAHAVRFEELPKKYARTRPSHGSIPAAYISMIGRDKRYRGSSYGGDLLVDALRRIVSAADQIGISAVMLDVLDCGDTEETARCKALYESYGFQPIASVPMRMFLPIAVAVQLVRESSTD